MNINDLSEMFLSCDLTSLSRVEANPNHFDKNRLTNYVPLVDKCLVGLITRLRWIIIIALMAAFKGKENIKHFYKILQNHVSQLNFVQNFSVLKDSKTCYSE